MNARLSVLGVFLVVVAATAATARADAADAWPPQLKGQSDFTERKLDTYQHGTRSEWGYAAAQRDTFLVLHPATQPRERAPLYVVLHSAGHDVHSCLKCTAQVGNHDIYHAPPEFFALYLDCRANKGDWWWGVEKHKGPAIGPTERRVMDSVRWVIEKYGIDPNRVYLCGNSMGGSGALGIGMRNGDVFAAVKANVPAGVEHVSSRMYFPPLTVPPDVALPDPPIVVDYSAQNDKWSRGHDAFYKAMNERRYALLMYWGPFGHANNHANILKVNDLINSFDWLAVRRDEPYPVFSNASSNDALPWPDKLNETKSGQVNAFFRWRNERDARDEFAVSLFLTSPADLKTTFAIPPDATADVTIRRAQAFQVGPAETVRWTYGDASGEAKADAAGRVTVPGLKVAGTPATLRLKKGS